MSKDMANKQVIRIGYLGPAGTFTEEAAHTLSGTLVGYDSVIEVFDAVKNGEITLGVVPIENSIEGSLVMTLDFLVHDSDLKIKKEIILPISHNLLINPNAELEDIEVVYSHHQALSQCRKYIQRLGVDTRTTTSTASAAEKILGHNNMAAIGTSRAADIYNLKIIARDIQDYKNNSTRFVVLGLEDHQPTGKDKTSLVFSLRDDKPGGLYEILGEFAKANINLTKVESRPSKEKLGRYLFFIDCEGHRKDSHLGNVLNIIKLKVEYIKILGSYPLAGDD